jgi:hypothetical protein
MKLHPNYKKALEERYSTYSLNEFIKEAEDSQLYIENTQTFIARTFYEEPKVTIIRDEYEEYYYGHKYEGKVKEEFEIIKYGYHFDREIDKSPLGKEILSKTFALKDKLKDKHPEWGFYNFHQEVLYMDDCKYFGAIEDDYIDSWSYTITKSEGWVKEKSYGPELICQGDFNFSYQYENYPYLEMGNNPFIILNAESGQYEDVYLEFADDSYMNFCNCKPKGLNHSGERYIEIFENIKKYGKK